MGHNTVDNMEVMELGILFNIKHERIVVNGAMGFIGSHFVNYIKSQEPTLSILVVDSLTYAANPNNIKHKVEFLKKDICDVTAEDLGDYDYLINFAAESHVDNSITDGSPTELIKKACKIRAFSKRKTEKQYLSSPQAS